MTRFQRVLIVLVFATLAFAVASATLNFHLANARSEYNHTFARSYAPKPGGTKVLANSRVYLHVEKREGLGGAFAWELREQLRAVCGMNVTLVNNEPGPEDFPLVFVAVRDVKSFWTPFYAQGSVSILGKFASYSSHIGVEWNTNMAIDPASAAGDLPLLIQMEAKSKTTASGIVSLPAYRKMLLTDIAREFAENIKATIAEVEGEVASDAKPEAG
jgi:hypothetical protein